MPTGTRVDAYTLGDVRARLRLADAYEAQGPDGPVTLMLVHPRFVDLPGIVEAIDHMVRVLAPLPPTRPLVRAHRALRANGRVIIVADAVEGTSGTAVLAGRSQGVGPRATSHVVGGIANALATANTVHGALDLDSLVIGKSGRIHIVDVVLGPATALAVRSGALAGGAHIAPEVTGGSSISGASDVYGLAALCYHVLTGRPLASGGARPSELVAGLPEAFDSVVVRGCSSDPGARYASTVELQKAVVEALAPVLGPDAARTAPIPVTAGASSGGETEADRALAAALADPTERWLISKGRFDYGPFSLAGVVEQIKKGEIVAGNIIVDKDVGARMDVGAHPQLAPLVDAARIALDHARRAQAEVHHQTREKRRSVTLYVLVAAGVLAVAGVVSLIVSKMRSDKRAEIASVASLGESDLRVTLSQPKKPKKAASGGGGSKPRGGNSGGSSIGGGDLTLDLSGDDDEGSETLDMNTIYGVYSRYGGQLGGCLARNGGGAANISIVIEGKSGKVTWLRVNDTASGGLHACIGRVMQAMKFPSVNGPRSRAEFDISL